MIQHTTSAKSLQTEQCKDKHFNSQLKRIESHYLVNTASRFMCAVDCHIPIQNVCRHVDSLFKSDDIAIIRKDHCRITSEIVEYLSCNKSLFPKRPIQFDLFEPIKQEQVQEPIDFELSLRIEGDLYEQHLVQEIIHFAGSLRIVPQNHKKALETGWENLFQGTLTDCDAFVSTLLNVKP